MRVARGGAFAGATLIVVLLCGCTGAAAPDSRSAELRDVAAALMPAVQPSRVIRSFDGARAWAHLEHQVALGPRPAGSTASVATRRYILDQLKASGIAAAQQAFTADTPAGPIPMVNVIATIPGQRPDRIVLASHYDTKRSPNFPFVGASDGASSTAALLELGRVLASRRGDLTIELLFLDGEEAVNWEWQGADNTYGSRHYVDRAQADGTIRNLRALVLLDMIGDRDLRIRRDANSTPWLVDLVWTAAARLGHRGVFADELTTIDDDHVPFLRAGVPSVDIIDLDYPQWHTAQDDLAHVSPKSLQIVGDVVLAALPDIEARLTRQARRIGF